METYIVRTLPNGLVLIISPDKERNVLKPQEIGKYFEEVLDKNVEKWENISSNADKIKSEVGDL